MHYKKDAARLIRHGRRIYGAVYRLSDGREVYMAWRKTREIFRGGEKMLSDAVVVGKASWAIDEDTLIQRRLEGIQYVGIWNIETDDKFIAPIAYFFDSTKSKCLNYEGRGGALQRYLPLANFRIVLGSTRIK
jgi:hypothetical protein